MIDDGSSSRQPQGGRHRRGLLALIVAVTLAAAACDDAPPEPEPVPGDVVVTLISPNGGEGAAVLATGDAGISDVTAETPMRVFHWREGGASRIVALRDEAGVISFTMSLEDLNRPPQLEVIEVADGANRLRASVAGYEVDVELRGGTGS